MIEANVRLVRDLIAANPEQFTMQRFGDEQSLQPPTLTKCNTAGCIAGWAASLSGDPIPEVTEPPNTNNYSLRWEQIKDAQQAIVTSACKFLGLETPTFEENSYGIPNEYVPAELFFIVDQQSIEDHLTYITAADAVVALDALLETGQPVWPDIWDRANP